MSPGKKWVAPGNLLEFHFDTLVATLFSVRCVILWNSLADQAVELDTCNKFKGYLDQFLSDKFYETLV